MTQPRLPAFIIIGAAKAATTWISHQLRSREDVFMPSAEPHYFSREYSRGESWYRSWFEPAQNGQLVGEKSADYLADANPEHIANMLPDVHLIACLRNPVERAYSDYCMLFRRGQVNGNVSQQLNLATTDAPRFLNDGLYARHLHRYLDHFPRAQLTLLLHEDVITRPADCIGEVCEAIGLPPRSDAAAQAARINDGAAPLVPMSLRRLPKPIKDLAKPLRGTTPFEAIRRLIARPVRYPPLTEDLRRRLEDFYARDVAELEKLLGRSLANWPHSAETVV